MGLVTVIQTLQQESCYMLHVGLPLEKTSLILSTVTQPFLLGPYTSASFFLNMIEGTGFWPIIEIGELLLYFNFKCTSTTTAITPVHKMNQQHLEDHQFPVLAYNPKWLWSVIILST